MWSRPMFLLQEWGEYKQEMEWSSQHMAQIQTMTNSLKFDGKHPFNQFLFWKSDSASRVLYRGFVCVCWVIDGFLVLSK